MKKSVLLAIAICVGICMISVCAVSAEEEVPEYEYEITEFYSDDLVTEELDPLAIWLEMGTVNDDVYEMQSMLSQLGYYDGTLDGDFGSYTEAALKQFQADFGLYVDGIAGDITMAELQSKTSYQTPVEEAQPVTVSPDISRGMTGNAVMDIQNILTRLGYYDGTLDGDFGSYTEDAIRRFQQKEGLYVDGVVGPQTLAALAAQNEAAAQNESATQNKAAVQNDATASNEASDPETEGNENDVKQLQQLLATRGYYAYEPDGEYGPYTEEMVRRYQQTKGLYVDGVAGPLTLKALQDDVAAQPDHPESLQEGMEGKAVLSLQTKLAELGYPVDLNGEYGAKTIKAVKDFQTLNGLYVDGEAGPLTLDKLDNDPVVYSETVNYDGITLTEDIANYMKNLFNAVTNDSMSQEEKLYATYDFIANRNNYPYMQNRIPYYRGMDWPVVYAHDMMYEGGSYCHGYASLFGYAAVLSGYNNVHWCQNGYHAWVDIDGLVYDPVFRDSSYATDVYGWTYEKAISYNGYLGAGYDYISYGEGTYQYIKAPNF